MCACICVRARVCYADQLCQRKMQVDGDVAVRLSVCVCAVLMNCVKGRCEWVVMSRCA